jgi:hypothetical protein
MLRTTGRRAFVGTLLLIGAIGLIAAFVPGAKSKPAHPFRPNVKVEITDDLMIVRSDGIPDHSTGDFPNQTNPNRILKQNYSFKIPRHPLLADEVSRLPMGPIGVAINGIPFYNPYNAEGQDAARNEVFDECCGHPDPVGRYHYHIYPKCIHSSFKDDAGRHSPLIGYAFDGFAIFGPLGEDGKRPDDLDECNGHSDDVRGYHYHVTNRFPYILGGYRGVVERSNFDRGGKPGRDGKGPEGRPVRRPPGEEPPPR